MINNVINLQKIHCIPYYILNNHSVRSEEGKKVVDSELFLQPRKPRRAPRKGTSSTMLDSGKVFASLSLLFHSTALLKAIIGPEIRRRKIGTTCEFANYSSLLWT